MLILDTNLAFDGATTQYVLPIDIDSICKFADQEFLAAGPEGLYLLNGNVDGADTKINARFITATMDFGINAEKKIRYVILSLEATGNLELSIKTERVSSQTYTVNVVPGIGQQDIRIFISDSLIGRFWTFTISNTTTGADFSIDEIKVMPLVHKLIRI